ncbi:CARDB domain-containing protein [Kineococcus glutinatus]|uniref:CARDB domain-containing protein n=1 Tax=Kineococcus glutinatus TaxID=1070872 RepID=A0ABP9HKW4_9ACTN
MRRRNKIMGGALGTLALLAGGGSVQAATPAPDLIVTAVEWTPNAPIGGQPVAFRATIKNQGTAATPSGVKHGVQFQVNGSLKTWSDSFTASLPPGQSVTVVANGGPAGATWTAAAGSPSITAYVDDAARIKEGNESNNKLSRTATISSGITTRLRTTASGSVVAVTNVPSSTAETSLGTMVTGSAYGACHDADGLPVSGTEAWLLDTAIGHDVWNYNGPFAYSGRIDVPATTRPLQVISNELDTGEIHKWNYGTPEALITCAAGTTAGFTRFQAKALTTKRYGPTGMLLGTFTAVLDLDIIL